VQYRVVSVVCVCDVFIAARPRIVEQPADQSVLEGESASLHCRASGVPRPSVSWLKNDLDLPVDARLRLDDNGTLQLTQLKRTDSGVYRCVASNSLGSVSEFARLHVFGEPIRLNEIITISLIITLTFKHILYSLYLTL